MLWLASLIALAATPGRAEPTVKATVAEPVVEELMGGCSLKCAFRWRVEVALSPKQKPQAVKVLNDESALTAWIAPAGSTGVGARFRLLCPKKFPQGMSGEVPLYGLDLVNGNWKNEDEWKQYGRLKRARLTVNDRPIATIAFADSRRWAKSTFPDVMLRDGDVITLEVLEIYPGTKTGLAISEIVLQGAH